MTTTAKGFSLIEVTVALVITLGIGAAGFHLFQQNERVFRDQNLIIEMQQAARYVASQIADELRMAGAGIPIYASSFDNGNSEAVAAILATTTTDRIDFRAGLGTVETYVTMPSPLELTLNTPAVLTVNNGAVFSAALGTSAPSGRFVYLWGAADISMWAWVRAELTAITSTTLTVTARQSGDAGKSGGVIQFAQPPAVALEQAVSFSLSGGSIRRATATNLTDQADPVWSAASEIGRDFTDLGFTYYDKNNNVVVPNTLDDRLAIAGIDVRVTAQAAKALADGSRPAYSLSLRTVPRNVQLR